MCVFTQILGGKTFSSKLLSALDQHIDTDKTVVYFKYEDYDKYQGAAFYKLSDSLTSGVAIKNKLIAQDISPENHSGLFFQSYQLITFMHPFVKNGPTILSLDETPQTSREWHTKVGGTSFFVRQLKFLLAWLLDHLTYKKIFNDVDFFLARTQRVKNSLVNYYDIPADKVEVTYLPLPTLKNTNIISDSKPIRLLFIGNEYARKGGAFLLTVFDDELLEKVFLTIISTDSKFSDNLDSRINFIQGCSHDEVLKHMAAHDIFVFPTKRDALGLVLCEAISCGLAIITRDCGAQKELVEHGSNGYVLDYNSSVQQWKSIILHLTENHKQVADFKKYSVEIASKLLSPEVFSSKLEKALKVYDE